LSGVKIPNRRKKHKVAAKYALSEKSKRLNERNRGKEKVQHASRCRMKVKKEENYAPKEKTKPNREILEVLGN